MSGRAGRRGKDDRGIVIQILDEQMEPDVAKNMIYGASDALFRWGILSYLHSFLRIYFLFSFFLPSFLLLLSLFHPSFILSSFLLFPFFSR